MAAWHRHQLVHLSARGWARLSAATDDAVSRAALAHWAAHDLPLVVARQPGGAGPVLRLGLPLPPPGRQRLSLQVEAVDVAATAAFPEARAIAPLLDPSVRTAFRQLCSALTAGGSAPRVYGSFAWQHLTGLRCLHAGSDLDLLVPVCDADAADVAASLLSRFGPTDPRLDGELVFPDHGAVAWREWLAARAGRTPQVLVKHLDRVALRDARRWAAAEPARP